MTRIIHIRGDVTGMLILFVVAFLGIWQLMVAYLRLNGLSITGYPDRGCWSKIIGAVLLVGSCSWYFSKPGHFASPDVEGIETLIVLLGGVMIATVLQLLLAGVARQLGRRRSQSRAEAAGAAEDLPISVDGTQVGARYHPGARDLKKNAAPVLLLHDYGGSREDVAFLAARLAASGHATLTVDLEGHGGNPRAVTSPAMTDLLDAAASTLRQKTGEKPLTVVGIGFGAVLALDVVARGAAERAVAIDPPARDEQGCARVNVFRELGPLAVVSAFIKPQARGPCDKPLSLARLLQELPAPGSLPPGKVTIIGTSEKWFNSPTELTTFAVLSGVPEPLFLPGNHATIAAREETVEATLASLS